MTRLLDEVVDLLERNDGKRYLYVSDNPENLDALTQSVVAVVDLAATDSLVYLVMPEGLDKVSGGFHGVFLDRDACATQDILDNVSLHMDAFMRYVDGRNGYLE